MGFTGITGGDLNQATNTLMYLCIETSCLEQDGKNTCLAQEMRSQVAYYIIIRIIICLDSVVEMISPQCTSSSLSSSWPCQWDDQSVDTHREKFNMFQCVSVCMWWSDRLLADSQHDTATSIVLTTFYISPPIQQVSSALSNTTVIFRSK